MHRRLFLRRVGATLATIGAAAWVGLAHHRPGHDRGPPGWDDDEEDPEEPEPDPADVWPEDWGHTLVVSSLGLEAA